MSDDRAVHIATARGIKVYDAFPRRRAGEATHAFLVRVIAVERSLAYRPHADSTCRAFSTVCALSRLNTGLSIGRTCAGAKAIIVRRALNASSFGTDGAFGV